jgi:enoyl-CoA hydratase/carnithine racemase
VALVKAFATDGVGRLTLARSHKRNAIDPELASDLRSAVARFVADGVHSAVLSAEGPVFCAGADIADLAAGQRAVEEAVDVLVGSPVHWTAAVRQPVFGAGLALIGACPSVLAAPHATFALPELARGFFPHALVGGLAALTGPRAAFDLAFSASPIDAERAAAVGLVSRVVTDANLDHAAIEWAAAIAARPAEAVADGVARWRDAIGSKLLQ